MNLKKRILSCILLFILLAAICIIGLMQQQEVQTMGRTSGDEGNKKIALTFDDGPHPYYTEQLLKGLKERNAKVTFFITGKNAESYPEIVKKIYEDEHLIGNHTYNHTQLTSRNRESFKEEIIKTNEVIKAVTGEDVIYVRPPYGSWNKEFEKELNMFPVLWTIDPLDWCSHDVSCIVKNVCAKVEENDIILMHDQYKTTVTAALKIVDELTEEGYEFVTVDELLFD
ncbi:peptidoglycan-N-acetylmuramic acid deacetylase PdaC [Lachnospiraceae bacterium]|nr:polysaccharide deacetylase family protein [Lachnospiraceae bacterium]GFI18552.1 peptidoglycan-N-acetylmuramic acid deacetylase PdaC [Lachnospiraceae bacterium]GFI70154.1 peptidoglycan-N-acetylmuramic acid deacetylase PdaC [Lachnospiraceae bacterium]